MLVTAPPDDAPSASPSATPRRRIRLATQLAIVGAALVGGVAFGAFGPDFGWGGSTPSPTPLASVTTSPDPPVETARLTIPEGFTAVQIYARASEVYGIPVEDFEAAAADPESIGLPPEANGSVEGWLGPYTYNLPVDSTAEEVLAALVDGMEAHLDALGVAPGDRLDVLTRASLVEREVWREEDRPKVARVIQNRLDAGWMLQFDSTVHYAAGPSGDVWTTAEMRAFDSPYNTYLYPGLPPGPICNPGDAAIEAVLNPADGPWFFFVTINTETGETLFAVTPEEHEANRALVEG